MAELHTERVKGEVVRPTATLKVIEQMGVTRAARAIGTSTTTLHKARKSGAVVSRVIEVAAQSLLREAPTEPNSKPVKLEKLHVVPSEPVLMLLEVPSDKARIVERLCKALGAKFVEA